MYLKKFNKPFDSTILLFEIYSKELPPILEKFIYTRLLGFPDSSVGKESACNARDPSLIPGLGRSAGGGRSYPLQYSSLENSMDCIVHGWQRVRYDWMTFTFTRLLIAALFIFAKYWKLLKCSNREDGIKHGMHTTVCQPEKEPLFFLICRTLPSKNQNYSKKY